MLFSQFAVGDAGVTGHTGSGRRAHPSADVPGSFGRCSGRRLLGRPAHLQHSGGRVVGHVLAGRGARPLRRRHRARVVRLPGVRHPDGRRHVRTGAGGAHFLLDPRPASEAGESR